MNASSSKLNYAKLAMAWVLYLRKIFVGGTLREWVWIAANLRINLMTAILGNQDRNVVFRFHPRLGLNGNQNSTHGSRNAFSEAHEDDDIKSNGGSPFKDDANLCFEPNWQRPVLPVVDSIMPPAGENIACLHTALQREEATCAKVREEARIAKEAFPETLEQLGVATAEAYELREEARIAKEAFPETLEQLGVATAEASELRLALSEETVRGRRLGELALRGEECRRRLLHELAEDGKAETELKVLAKVVGRAAKAISAISGDPSLLKTMELVEPLRHPQADVGLLTPPRKAAGSPI